MKTKAAAWIGGALTALALVLAGPIRGQAAEPKTALPNGISYAACDQVLAAASQTRDEQILGVPLGVLPDAARSALDSATASLKAQGIQYSYCVLNLDTGRLMTENTIQRFYSASCTKAPYIVSLLESGYRPTNDMFLAGHNSDNDAYVRLWNVFGNGSYQTFCSEAGVRTGIAAVRYTNMTSLELLRLWYHITPFLLEDAEANEFARETFSDSACSAVNDIFAGAVTVYSKAGWISDGSLRVYNSAGLVMDGNHPCLICLMTACDGKEEEALDLARALYAVHEGME
ncbi:MAG: hypothetical protein ACI4OJ_09130 [Lachnospiraceae bacterium]